MPLNKEPAAPPPQHATQANTQDTIQSTDQSIQQIHGKHTNSTKEEEGTDFTCWRLKRKHPQKQKHHMLKHHLLKPTETEAPYISIPATETRKKDVVPIEELIRELMRDWNAARTLHPFSFDVIRREAK